MYFIFTLATELGLKDPQSYTGYSFRRSALTQALSNGASAQDLKTHFDLKSWQQYQVYSSESKKRKLGNI